MSTATPALTDALRLSRGMTYKNAVAGLKFGGGKSVILASDTAPKSPALFRAFGRAVESLGGRYITAEDVGCSVDDMRSVKEVTSYVSGLAEERRQRRRRPVTDDSAGRVPRHSSRGQGTARQPTPCRTSVSRCRASAMSA